MVFTRPVLVVVHHDVEGPMQTVFDLPVAADQCGGPLSGVLLGKQIEPLGLAGFLARCPRGDNVDESL